MYKASYISLPVAVKLFDQNESEIISNFKREVRVLRYKEAQA